MLLITPGVGEIVIMPGVGEIVTPPLGITVLVIVTTEELTG